MNLDLDKYPTVIPSSHVPGMKRALAKTPSDFTWMLTKPHADLLRLQGDVVRDVPIASIDSSGNAKKAVLTVMILNNSCDLPDGRLDMITVAPLLDFSGYVKSLPESWGIQKKAAYIESIKHNKITELLYVPSAPGFSNGAVVCFAMFCSVSAALYQSALVGGKRVASFSRDGFYYLLIKLIAHIGRPESEDVIRVPLS